MKRSLFFAAVCGSICVCVAGSPFANCGFETELDGSWRLAKLNCAAVATVDEASPCEGGKSLKLSVTDFKPPYCAMLNTANITDAQLRGKAISIAYRGRNESALLLRYRYVNNGKKDYRYDILPLTPSSEWRRFNWPLDPPEGTDEVCVELRASAAGDYEFDDLRLIPAGEARIIANGDFEKALSGTWRLVNHSRKQPDAVRVSSDEADPASGKRSLKIELREDVVPMAEALQKIPIRSTRAFKGKAISFAFRGSRPTMVVVDFKSVSGGKTEHTYTLCKLPGDMGWKRFSFPLNVPENAVDVTVELRANHKGVYWFDEVAFTDIPQ